MSIPIDQSLKRSWEKQLARLDTAKREGAGAYDNKYEAIGEIIDHDPPLYLAGGCATVREFLAKYVGEDERSVRRDVRVARFASPAEEERFGTSKLDAALTFLEAKTGRVVRGRVPVAFDKLKIDATRDDGEVRLALADATVDEIRIATRRLDREHAKPHPKAPPIVKALAALMTTGALKDIKIRYSDGAISLSGVALYALRDLAKVLARVKVPEPK